MTLEGPTIDPGIEAAITATVLDYYEGWFEADATRMGRALHPRLVKRSVHRTPGEVAEATYNDMVAATAQGEGTRHGPDQRSFTISINRSQHHRRRTRDRRRLCRLPPAGAGRRTMANPQRSMGAPKTDGS
jgi:hypothetical protein